MNASEMDKMSNHDLNKLATERVMQIVPRQVRVKGSDECVTCHTDNKAISDGVWSKSDLERYGKPKGYSTDMRHAFELLAQFESWSMRYDSEIKSVVVCVMYDGNRFYAMHPSPAKAITLTSLMAVGEKTCPMVFGNS